jgi:hypothetical protein
MDGTKAAVEAVLAAHPDLSAYGIGLYHGEKTLAERRAEQARWREDMLCPDELVQFEDACRFIAETGIRKTVNRRHSSYGWKHIAEKWAETYICNGVMIAAAYHMGVAVKINDSPNPMLSIKEPKRPKHMLTQVYGMRRFG